MAGGLLEYSGLVTKTKAMRARLLGADDYTAISEYESVTDFIAFLREQPAYAPVFERHGEVAHRGQDRKSTRLNSSHNNQSRMPSSA